MRGGKESGNEKENKNVMTVGMAENDNDRETESGDEFGGQEKLEL